MIPRLSAIDVYIEQTNRSVTAANEYTKVNIREESNIDEQHNSKVNKNKHK